MRFACVKVRHARRRGRLSVREFAPNSQMAPEVAPLYGALQVLFSIGSGSGVLSASITVGRPRCPFELIR
eukprot:4509764-Lingulodinium_polyedra.AAC.1